MTWPIIFTLSQLRQKSKISFEIELCAGRQSPQMRLDRLKSCFNSLVGKKMRNGFFITSVKVDTNHFIGWICKTPPPTIWRQPTYNLLDLRQCAQTIKTQTKCWSNSIHKRWSLSNNESKPQLNIYIKWQKSMSIGPMRTTYKRTASKSFKLTYCINGKISPHIKSIVRRNSCWYCVKVLNYTKDPFTAFIYTNK